jgi:MoxR-like ATPase
MTDQAVEFDKLLKYGMDNKPKELIISDLKWKYLVRSVIRGENILMVGPTGCGKTMAARLVSKVLNRPFFKFNMGSSDDARATLIGNTTYKKEIGTVFHPSPFVKAITTPKAVVLLDELTRGSHSAWNIAIPVLDFTQRDLRLDEDSDSDVIHVADGVCFIATANIGNEYTATRVLDKAISGRFPIKIEMEPLDGDQLKDLFSILYRPIPKAHYDVMAQLASISDDIRLECKKEDANISSIISPRSMVKMTELVRDEFTLAEIAEMAIYPEYPDDGGADSERTFVKQILQIYFPVNATNPVNDVRKKKSVDF